MNKTHANAKICKDQQEAHKCVQIWQKYVQICTNMYKYVQMYKCTNVQMYKCTNVYICTNNTLVDAHSNLVLQFTTLVQLNILHVYCALIKVYYTKFTFWSKRILIRFYVLPTLFLCSFWTIFSFHALFHLKFSALQRSLCVVSLFCSFQSLKCWNQIVSSFSGCSCHRTSWERQLIFRQVSEFTMLSDSVGNPVWMPFQTDYVAGVKLLKPITQVGVKRCAVKIV